FERYFSAPKDIAILINEITNTKRALEGFQSAVLAPSSRDLDFLQQLVSLCFARLSQLERLISKTFVVEQRMDGAVNWKVNRMAWVRSKGKKAEKLKVQLREMLSSCRCRI